MPPEAEHVARPVLSVYKRMLQHARRLPAADRDGTVAQIRAAFREHKSEANSERCGAGRRLDGVTTLVKRARSRPPHGRTASPSPLQDS